MRFDRLTASVLAAATLALAGCSADSSTLTTASLFGSGQAAQASPAAPPPPAPFTPSERALNLGAVVARATQCGYYFDPGRLKAAWLAYEAQQGTPPDQVALIDKQYEYTRLTVQKTVTAEPDYCSEAKTKEIKASLTRHLAGDFTPPPRKIAAKSPGMFGELFENNSGGRETINQEYMRDKDAPKTKRVSDD